MRGLPKLAAPARRALASVGVSDIRDLARFTEAELAALHGMGPNALATLKQAMEENGVRFRAA